jgi:hypothetical protein
MTCTQCNLTMTSITAKALQAEVHPTHTHRHCHKDADADCGHSEEHLEDERTFSSSSSATVPCDVRTVHAPGPIFLSQITAKALEAEVHPTHTHRHHHKDADADCGHCEEHLKGDPMLQRTVQGSSSAVNIHAQSSSDDYFLGPRCQTMPHSQGPQESVSCMSAHLHNSHQEAHSCHLKTDAVLLQPVSTSQGQTPA